MDYPDLTGDQFKKLVNLAKLIGGFTIFAIALISSVAIYFSYNSLKDLKGEVQKETTDMKEEVKNLVTYSQGEIDRVNSYSEKQIRFATDDAVKEARTSAQKEVERFFNNDSEVKSLVRNTAEGVLGQFEKDVNDFTLVLPDVFIALDKIGRDQRVGLEKIIELQNSTNIFVKKIATKVFEEKRNDYYKAYNNKNGYFWSEGIRSFFNKLEKDPASYFAFADIVNSGNKYLVSAEPNSNLWANKNKTELINHLIKNVNSQNDLNVISLSFFLVLEMTDIKCELFDFKNFAIKSKSYNINPEYRN